MKRQRSLDLRHQIRLPGGRGELPDFVCSANRVLEPARLHMGSAFLAVAQALPRKWLQGFAQIALAAERVPDAITLLTRFPK